MTGTAFRVLVVDDDPDMAAFLARLLNEALDEPGRLRVIETMWNVAFADGAASEYEDNLIWRAADLLHVPAQVRIALRQRVAERGPIGSL